jgi:hypothetical protein
MRDDVMLSLCRYEAMTRLSDYWNEDCPDQEVRDREMFGDEYGLLAGENGYGYLSTARMVRFLVEVCGHSYEEALEGVVEHFQKMPAVPSPSREAPRQVARRMKESHKNTLEALVDLKIARLISENDESALAYIRAITGELIHLRTAPLTAPKYAAEGLSEDR